MTKITGANITIMVENMDRSIEFYQTIGLTLQQRWDNHYAMLTAEGITLGIHPSSDSKHSGKPLSSGSTSIGLFIDDFEAAKNLLDKMNVPYEAEDDGKSGHYLHFKDPDNTILYFVLPKW